MKGAESVREEGGSGFAMAETGRWEGVLQACCSGSSTPSRVTASLFYSPSTGNLLVMPSCPLEPYLASTCLSFPAHAVSCYDIRAHKWEYVAFLFTVMWWPVP